MSENAFSGSKAKIARARKLLTELEAALAQFVGTNPVTIQSVSVENDGRSFSVRINVEGVPANISAIFGDVIHNLRTALDVASCELVRSAGRSDKKVYFPFSDKLVDLEKMIQDKNFNRAGPMAVSLLYSLQPYRGGNLSLRAIHDLDLQDKHQKLIPISQSYASPVIRIIEGSNPPRFELYSTEISDYALVFPPESSLYGEKVIPTFVRLVELVDGIIADFQKLATDPLFPGT